MDSIIRQMWNLIGSHDTKRIYNECEGNINKIKLAIAYQFLYIGVPYIYYGDEIGLDGEDEITQKDIAKNLGISRSYVSRIEKRALTKLLREFIKNKDN